MRPLMIFCTLLLLCGLAAAQATAIGGYASNWPPSYGVYAAPFVPLVTTPSVSLGTYSPSATGASNATSGLVAGATNATLSMVAPPPQGVLTVPQWYGPTPEFGPSVAEVAREHARHHKMHGGDFGAASFQSTTGLATLAGLSRPQGKAARTYTNADIDRINQNTGTVKWDNKSEKIQ